MTDFTKEELQDINYALTEYGDFESARVENLVGKIQFMIDEYCEHSPIWKSPNHVICYCDKCKKVLEL